MRTFNLLFIASLLSSQEVVDDFTLVSTYRPYVDQEGMVLRSMEDNVTPSEWPEAKCTAYAQYPLAVALESSRVPIAAAEAHSLLKASAKPIVIGYRWVKDPLSEKRPPCLRRVVLWLERRPKYVNLDEIQAAVKQGVFDNLFPPYPINGFDALHGARLSAGQGDPYPGTHVGTWLSLGGKDMDPMPVQCRVDYYSNYSLQSNVVVDKVLDDEMLAIGSGLSSGDEVFRFNSGIVLKTVGTQFGHTGYRWVSEGNLFQMFIQGKDRSILEAFVQQRPSELPADFTIDPKAVAMQMLRRGLERLRQAGPVIEDDPKMIRIRQTQNRDVFGRGLELLLPLKDLWPVTYGHQKDREARFHQHISWKATTFSWQTYIDEETAARAKVVAAVEAFAIQAEKRGLVHQAKVPRDPWATYAGDALPPCWVLGPEK